MSKSIFRFKSLPKSIASLSVATLLITLAGTALGQDSQAEGGEKSSEQVLRQHGLYKASALINKPIENQKNEELGEISEIVIDESGQVQYAVLSHGGILGMGEKLTAVSWNTLEVAPKGNHYLFKRDVTGEQLANAPTFSEKDWPSKPQITETSTFKTQ